MSKNKLRSLFLATGTALAGVHGSDVSAMTIDFGTETPISRAYITVDRATSPGQIIVDLLYKLTSQPLDDPFILETRTVPDDVVNGAFDDAILLASTQGLRSIVIGVEEEAGATLVSYNVRDNNSGTTSSSLPIINFAEIFDFGGCTTNCTFSYHGILIPPGGPIYTAAIYSGPVPVPLMPSLALFASGVAGLAVRARKNTLTAG